VLFVFPHSPDDAVGVVFVGSSSFASGFTFAEFAFDVGRRFGQNAVLDDARDLDDAVDAAVAAEVKSVPTGRSLHPPDETATAPVPHQRSNFAREP
jgi:hypothetical protein